ncbi:MAG: metallophosphoesterase [Xanthobacteraceae bacterium]
MFVLAHLSDPHLAPLPKPRPAELIGKRITGYLNWQLRRGAHHRRDVLDTILRDIAAAEPDHVAMTGDLANLSLPGEYRQGREFLARLGTPDRVSVIPGNHDAYVRGSEKMFFSAWREYLAGDRPTNFPFPFLRRRGPIAIVGLSTAVPTLPFFATGRLGSEQLARFDALLAELPAQQCFRIVLIHHPPAGVRSWLRRLEDAESFRAVIARRGAELILSGHDHKAARNEIPGPSRSIPVLQVPSASAPFGDKHGAAAYNLYRIGGKPGGWTCEMEARGLGAGGKVATLARTQLIERV